MNKEIQRMKNALHASWSAASSSKYTPQNPALGQCGVTALVANDILGGDILKTRTHDMWHFYNKIDDTIIDFTQSQFDTPPKYDHVPSNRQEALDDTHADQYAHLSKSVKACWNDNRT